MQNEPSTIQTKIINQEVPNEQIEGDKSIEAEKTNLGNTRLGFRVRAELRELRECASSIPMRRTRNKTWLPRMV